MTEPRWLTPQEREAWLAVLALTMHLPSRLDSELHSEARITLFDYNVMAMLSEAEEFSLPMSELAIRTNASLSRLSHVVKKLEKRGWLDRSQSELDARVTMAHLTQDGFAKLAELAPGHVEAVREALLDPLTADEVKELARIGRKITQALAPDHWIFRDSSV
ncbi:MarR family winged helix-turn-helix transcriptional regulator [Neomicrococcus aestuarii]|uniref:MarR family transcriptional regulator n=1 Tax=Neomicrococcus aestuarii TaxID=556325 RepID=A0A1L2ZPH2_9MICC|nr:MarR family transcriptional regulator [Neomicrococcus aestuarii]APF41325.1 MarR family transcriptional regulator [Neomicrococcus aestuarii]MBB5513248.1 DNA-binding MarR family transcriptional regulator [Neomicrococcus aestuarii]